MSGSAAAPFPLEEWRGRLVDCDVHLPAPSIESLAPYLGPMWTEFIAERGWRRPANLPFVYPGGLPGHRRTEWQRDKSESVDGELAALREHVLEGLGVRAAVASCYFALDSLRHPDWAAAVASAVNDWVAAEWLGADPRLRAAIMLPANDPKAMAAEIDRLGGTPGFVEILLPVRSGRLYGERIWYPVWEAACRHELVVGLHWGGTTEGAPSTTGWPSWYVEEYAAEVQVYAAQITSLVAGGVFQEFPDIRVSVLEGGFLWLPAWMWRMNKEWKGLRREIPWVDRLPSELIREHMRFSLAPLDLGPPEEIELLLSGWEGRTC